MNVIVINRLSEPTEIDFRPASMAQLTDEQIASLPLNRRQASMAIPPGRTELPKGTEILTSEPYISVSVSADITPTPPSKAPARTRTSSRNRQRSGGDSDKGGDEQAGGDSS